MLIDTIREICLEKAARHILPRHALAEEILALQKGLTREQLNAQALMLAGAGRIRTGRTLNSTYYTLIEQ